MQGEGGGEGRVRARKRREGESKVRGWRREGESKEEKGHLDVVVGVPVTVIDDDRVRRRQVDAQPARPRAAIRTISRMITYIEHIMSRDKMEE